MIFRFDIELLVLTYAAPQFVSLSRVFGRQRWFAEVRVTFAERCIGHGEIAVEADCLLEKKRASFLAGLVGLASEAIGLKGFERGCGNLLNRRIELLNRAERLTKFVANVSSSPPQS